MTLYEVLKDKYCFVYCGPERCNCKRGREALDLIEINNMALKYDPCPTCAGHGQVGDYGSSSIDTFENNKSDSNNSDFFGPKVCPDCKGTGQVRARDRYGRYVKLVEGKPPPPFKIEE